MSDGLSITLYYIDGSGIFVDDEGDEWVLSPEAYTRRLANCKCDDCTKIQDARVREISRMAERISKLFPSQGMIFSDDSYQLEFTWLKD